MIQRDKSQKPQKIITSAFAEEDAVISKFEQTLRPRTLAEYVGQEIVKKNLIICIEAGRKRREPIEHILIHSPAGLGKTTLANIIANEIGANIRITSGPVLEKQGDLAAILTNLQNNDVLFIDEIHRLKPAVEEILYSAMEDFGIDLILGKGPSAKSMRLNLPRFTLIGATTKISMLSSPLRDRFGHTFKLNFYSIDEIKQIILRSAKILNCEITQAAAHKLALSSRQTPRIANRLLRRTRDFADFNAAKIITEEIVAESLSALGVDEIGLDNTDRNLIRFIIQKFHGGPVGLNTLAAATSEEEETIEDIYEPYLMQLGFLDRTPRGRIATENAYKHLGIKWQTKDSQQSLL
ncbi:Holliday junction branch migration DNA helicase RuvB [Candidatus Peregrinibacteria bacterium]|nr:Holliday junction branch migration DNA helicase RuvB [Candidatus Peregrinibacteria bacterium]